MISLIISLICFIIIFFLFSPNLYLSQSIVMGLFISAVIFMIFTFVSAIIIFDMSDMSLESGVYRLAPKTNEDHYLVLGADSYDVNIISYNIQHYSINKKKAEIIIKNVAIPTIEIISTKASSSWTFCKPDILVKAIITIPEEKIYKPIIIIQ